MYVGHAETRGELMQHREVLFESTVRPDEQQSRPRVEVTLVRVEVPDDILDALVRDDAADEHDIGPVVVELARSRSFGRQIEMREVGDDRQYAGGGEPERLELLCG